ncbi:MAG: hypothetical protein ACRD5I_15170, partial [Candidatus Acidiferrales bacterium]
MKPIVLFVVILLLLPFAALADEKDLELGVNYRHLNRDCSVQASEISCSTETSSDINPDLAVPKLIHSATLSLLAEPGHTCEAFLEIKDVLDNGFTTVNLLAVFATEQSPGALSLTFVRPILLEDRDQFRLRVANVPL